MKGARRTDKECHNCKEANYVKVDHELYCPNCAFTPAGSSSPSADRRDPWDSFHRGQKLADKRGDRVYMVGGHPSAYVGEGEYEYDYDDHQFNPPQ